MEGIAMTKVAMQNSSRHLPKTYRELVGLLPPRPIHDEIELRSSLDIIDRMAGFKLNADQEDYLEAVSTFVEAYETAQFPDVVASLTPLEALNALLAEHNMSASDLGRLLGNRTLGAAILSGRRALSKSHVKKLAEHFKVDPGLFL
jgi:HTH-type transcriptional regulator / antitoxin HigA